MADNQPKVSLNAVRQQHVDNNQDVSSDDFDHAKLPFSSPTPVTHTWYRYISSICLAGGIA